MHFAIHFAAATQLSGSHSSVLVVPTFPLAPCALGASPFQSYLRCIFHGKLTRSPRQPCIQWFHHICNHQMHHCMHLIQCPLCNIFQYNLHITHHCHHPLAHVQPTLATPVTASSHPVQPLGCPAHPAGIPASFPAAHPPTSQATAAT